MKTFLIILLFIMSFSGCSTNNAFHEFNMDEMQEFSEEKIQSSVIKNEKENDGLVTVIYLNQVYPERYKDYEYFYAYLYSKSDHKDIKFLLNEEECFLVEELPSYNKFSNLTSFKADWKRYYLLKFEKQGGVLNFKVQNAGFSSEPIKYLKEPGE